MSWSSTPEAEGSRPGSLRGARRLAVGLAVLAGVIQVAIDPAASVAQTVARDTLPIVRRVEIVGNEAFPDEEIKRAIATRESGCKSFFLKPMCLLGFDAFKRVERLRPRELRTDPARIRIFYFRRGFRRAQVDASLVRSDGDVEVTFRVEEGEPVRVRSLGLAGLPAALDSARTVSRLPLQQGEPFSELKLTASREELERRLRNVGYAHGEVLVQASLPASDSLGAYVVVDALPGPLTRIGNIQVVGNSEVDAGDVKRLLSFRSGDVYREDEIVRSQRKLYSLALFNYVDIVRADSGPQDSTLDVRVQVNEADMRSVELGFGLTTAECLQLEGGWTHRNFLGGTRQLMLSASLSNIGTSALARTFPCNQAGVELSQPEELRDPFNAINWRVRTDFQQPWFLGSENTLQLGLFSERQSLPDVFARTSFGGDISFTRQVSRRTALKLTYRFERDRLAEQSSGILFCANFGICRPEDIAQLERPRRLAWTNVSLSRSRTDALLSPTRGYRLNLEAEHASRLSGSEWAYNRAQAELSWYQPIGGGVLAVRLRGGLVDPIGSGLEDVELGGDRQEPITHPLKRLYSGGGSTVRGFGQNLLGPKVLFADSIVLVDTTTTAATCRLDELNLTDNVWDCDPAQRGLVADDFDPRPVGGRNAVVGNVEYRFPLFGRRWQGTIFVDAGRVWTGEEITASTDVEWTPGLGVRYQSPVGPLRLDIGYNTSGPESLPVVSQVGGEVVQLVGEANDPTAARRPIEFHYDPYDTFLSRLQLHFSIGQAF